jgi:hypothetical protein
MRHSFIVKRAVVAVAAFLVLGAALAPAGAQGRYVRLDGSVQWIAADKMQLILDGGASVAIDLTQAPQEQYRALRERDRVSVIGVVSADNRRVLATSVTPGEMWGIQAP